MISRSIDHREWSAKRIFNALMRRIQEIPHTLAWYSQHPSIIENRNRLISLRNRHTGLRCFIMGNGPSLAMMDLEPLRNEITFGMNRIYLLFDQMSFKPSYYVCVNELVLEQFAHEIQALTMPKFLNWNRRRLFPMNDVCLSFLKISTGLTDHMERNLLNPLPSGGTVTFVAIQVAYYMGFNEVILIGIDHRFTDKGIPNITEIRQANKDLNHFHPSYFPKGVKWQYPDLFRSDQAYMAARKAFEREGRHIFDATLNGNCQVFNKVDFSSLV